MKKLNSIIFMVITGLVVLMVKIPFVFAGLQYQETYVSQAGMNNVLLVVNSAIYDAIYEPSLKQYVADLEAEDYNVVLIRFISGTPQDLKDYMKLIPGLKGVVFIGDLPVAWYETENDFNMGISVFPIDLFYMDLDGVWKDINADNIYDTHEQGNGSLAPEIWLGRLTASVITNPDMDEVGILRNFFAKNHAYRKGGLSRKSRALAYLDDSWRSFGKCYLDTVYPDVTVVDDEIVTAAPDYIFRLKEGYEWIHICVHSSPQMHFFPSGRISSRGSFSHQQGEPWGENNEFWRCNVNKHSPNYMCYRSCVITQGLAGKQATVCFTLLVDDNSGTNDKVAVLDVYDETDQKILAKEDVYRYDFEQSDFAYGVCLSFIIPPVEHKVVFRTYWLGQADITQAYFRSDIYPPDNVGSQDIRDIKPDAIFYNLFACSNARYTEKDYMGGNYIFAKTSGLGVIGSTKTGSMLGWHEFYPYLGMNSRGKLGEAFKTWFERYGINERNWHYGMTLLGDPTLSLDPPIASIDTVKHTGQLVTFSGSGKINKGTITAYSWRSSIDGFLSSSSFFSTSSLSIGNHIIYFKVKDDKGRWSSEDKFTLEIADSVKPTGRVKIIGVTKYLNYPSFFVETTVATLDLKASDSGSGMGSDAQMQFSNDGSYWSAPEQYTTDKRWALIPGSGEKIVYVKFKDVAGNWSEVYSDTTTILNQPSVNQPPIALIKADYISGKTPLSVCFYGDCCSDPDGKIVSYFWNFGNGETSTQMNPSSTFKNSSWRDNKYYTVSLTVKDNLGAVSTAQIKIKVKPWRKCW